MPDITPNHQFRLFSDGEENWEHRLDLEALEAAVPIVDVDANTSVRTPHHDALFIAHDTRTIYRGDGDAWNEIGTIEEYVPDPVAGGDGSSRSTVRAVDFGADPTGVEPSSSALQDAHDAADPGDKLIFGATGTYYLDSQIDVTKRIEIDLYEGDIESDYHDETPYPDDQAHYMPLFRIHGTLGSSTTLTQAHEQGTDQIHVTNPGMFTVGDGILIRNNNTSQNGVNVPALDYAPTVSRVREIQDGVIYIEDELEMDYASGHYASEADFLKRPIIRNVTVYPRREPAFDATAKKVLGGPRHIVATEYCDRPLVENVEAEGYDSHLWTGYDDRNARVVDCSAIRPMNLSGSCGEPFAVHGSNNPSIERPVIRGCRRGIDARSGVTTITIEQPIITGVSFIGICWHSTSTVLADIHVEGGRVDCRPTDPTMENTDGSLDMRRELQWGRPFMTGVNGTYTSIGTTYISRLDAVVSGEADFVGGKLLKHSSSGNVLTLSGQDVNINGMTIGSTGAVANLVTTNSTAENITMSDVTFDCSGSPNRALLIDQGTDLDIRGRVTGGTTTTAVDVGGGTDITLDLDIIASAGYAYIIDAVDNLRVSGRIEGTCSDEVVYLSGGSDLRFDCDISASGSNTVRGYRIFGGSDITITGSYVGPAIGIMFSGAPTHTVVKDMRIEVTDGTRTAAVGTDSSATGITGVKWLNNDLRGSVTNIHMDVDVNGLWAVDNVTSGVTYGAGSTVAREEGNMLF